MINNTNLQPKKNNMSHFTPGNILANQQYNAIAGAMNNNAGYQFGNLLGTLINNGIARKNDGSYMGVDVGNGAGTDADKYSKLLLKNIANPILEDEITDLASLYKNAGL